MSENRRQVLEMLSAGKITAEEAERLIAALEKVAGGEKLTEEETKIAQEFLYSLGCRSDSMVDDGGCF